jgi:radical SAM protein with 4Fe4S-binding SPASM domain
MIEKQKYDDFAKTLQKKKKGLNPVTAQIELTYRCAMNCIHCYCNGYSDGKELTVEQWKNILDQLHKEGCLYLTLTGGEPFDKEGFWDIYDYAKKKGFITTVFSNGLSLTDEDIEHFVTSPPLSLEITLQGVTKEVFEKVTQKQGSFEKVMENIQKLVTKKVPLVLKTVLLKENKHEIFKVKKFVENLLGPKKFKTDSFIIPGLAGDKKPCEHRLSPEEILEIEESDIDMIMQREEQFQKHKPLMRDPKYKYHCNSWFNQVFITPSGKLRFCHISDKHSSDLTKIPFEQAFYLTFPAIWEEENKSFFKCMTCELREYCHYCPARAFLETGDECAHIEYYCKLAKQQKQRTKDSKRLMNE